MIISRDGTCLSIKFDGTDDTKLLRDVLDSALIANYYWQEASTDLTPEEERKLTWENVVLSNLLDSISEIRKELKNEKRY